MRVIITGGTGLIGSALSTALLPQGHEVIILSRTAGVPPLVSDTQDKALPQRVVWDGCSSAGWGELITRDTAIVNLAGVSPAHWRWTPPSAAASSPAAWQQGRRSRKPARGMGRRAA